ALPLRDLLRALRSAGFDGVVSVDAPGATPGPDAIAVARAASDALEFIARLD
ncbi:MAG: hypothetical protein IT330_19350, partial [Anaerolineae bacterium]|nr:hypothetical protein [Anaerolineae bacterium]